VTANPKDLVGARKAPLRYVPPALMIAASGPMEDGAIKYGPFNWREYPVEVVTYVEAAIRHLLAFLDGQDRAEDSGHFHIDHAIAGLGIVADSREMGTLIDNRFHAGPAADMLRDRDKSVKSAPDESALATLHGPDIAVEPWGTGDGTFHGMDLQVWQSLIGAMGPLQVGRPDPVQLVPGSEAVTGTIDNRGEWPPDTRVAGRLTCCGQSEHAITCPQWRS
jgi:hypothetical protein